MKLKDTRQRLKSIWEEIGASKDNNILQLLSPVQLSTTPGTAVRQASLSFTISQSLLKLMSVESVMPCSYLILCRPLLLLPSFPASGNEFQWAGSWHIGASVLPINIPGWFPLGLAGLISLQSKGLSRVFSSSTIWKHQFFSAQPSFWCNSHICMWRLEKP